MSHQSLRAAKPQPQPSSKMRLPRTTGRVIFKITIYFIGAIIAEFFGLETIEAISSSPLIGWIALLIGVVALIGSIVIFFRKEYYLHCLPRLQYVYWMFGVTGVFFSLYVIVYNVAVSEISNSNIANDSALGIIALYGIAFMWIAHLKPPVAQQAGHLNDPTNLKLADTQRTGADLETLPEPIKIIYCYARKDEALRSQLEKHLETLRRAGSITTWYDQNISAGTPWKREIVAHLNTSDIILLLISPDFVRSDYCHGIEMQQALKRQERGDARVVPILLRPVNWSELPIADLQALPTNAQPVTTWRDLDEAFVDIEKGICQVIDDLRSLKKKQKWINNGDVYYKSQQYEEALIAYEQALGLDPTDTSVQCQKGHILFRLGRYNDALVAYEQAIRIQPDNSAAYYAKGTILDALGRYEEALDAYRVSQVGNYHGLLTGSSEEPVLWNLINTIYNTILERNVDKAGFRIYSSEFLGNTSIREIVRHIGYSEEYKERFIRNQSVENAVRLCYRHFLVQDPNSNDLQHYVNIANAQGFDTVIDSLIDSNEYTQKFGDDLPPRLEVRFFLVKKDFLHFYTYTISRRRRIYVLVLLFVIILSLFFGIIVPLITGSFSLLTLWSWLFILLLFPLILWYSGNRFASRAAGREEGERVVRLTSEGVRQEAAKGEGTTSWRAIKAIGQDRYNLYLIHDTTGSNIVMAVIIPRHAFPTQQDAKMFLEQARQYWQKG